MPNRHQRIRDQVRALINDSVRPTPELPQEGVPPHGKFAITTPQMLSMCEQAYKMRDLGGLVRLHGSLVKITKFERDIRTGMVFATYERVGISK